MSGYGVIFDLDGTLIDSLTDIVEAMNDALREADLPLHRPAAYPKFVGRGVDYLVEQALPPGEQHRVAEFRTAFRRHYKTGPEGLSKPYSGITELLNALQAAGVPMAVLSNKRQEPCEALVHRFFERDLFVEVCGERDRVPLKPDPSEALRLAERMDVPPTQCHFIGDTEIDMATALAARMVAVGVSWGFRSPSELREAGAATVLEHPDGLLTLLGITLT